MRATSVGYLLLLICYLQLCYSIRIETNGCRQLRDCIGNRTIPAHCYATVQPGVQVGEDTVGSLLTSQVRWHMPGLEHIAQGFDTVTGKESGHPIFDLKYCSADPLSSSHLHYVYRGNLYDIPIGVDIINTPVCSLSASTTVHSYSSSLAQSMASESSMSVSVSAKGHYGPVHASASASYSQSDAVEMASSMAKSGKVSIAVTSTRCLTYKFNWIEDLNQDFGRRYLHENFARELDSMETVSDALRLVEKYGTHFYAYGEFGGKLEKISTVSDKLLTQHSEGTVSSAMSADFSADVGASGLGASVDVSASGSLDESGTKSKIEDSELQDHTESSSIKSYGGAPYDPSTTSFQEWATTIDSLPVVINYDLEEILSVIPVGNNNKSKSIRSLWMAGVNEYYMANALTDSINDYVISISTKLQGGTTTKMFGPFAYQLPEIMSSPTLFKFQGTSQPILFKSGSHVQIDVPIKQSMPDAINYIDIYSLTGYLNAIGKKASTPDQPLFVEQSVSLWPIDHVNFWDAATGKSYLYTKSESDVWTKGHGRLYRTGRTFYLIELEMHLEKNQSNRGNLNTGLLEVVLYGSDNIITEYLDMSLISNELKANDPVNSIKIFSNEDIGEISSVDLIPILPTEGFMLYITEIRVTALDDIVYTSKTPKHIIFGQEGVYKYTDYSSADAMQEHLLARVQLISTAEQNYIDEDTQKTTKVKVQSSLSVLLYPDADISSSILYGYPIRKGDSTSFTLQEAKAACFNLGGIIANPAYLERIKEEQENWCFKGWAVGEAGSASCMPIVSNVSACTVPSFCGVVCAGTLPSEPKMTAYNYYLNKTTIPVALTASFSQVVPNIETEADPSSSSHIEVIEVANCASIVAVAGKELIVRLISDVEANINTCFRFVSNTAKTGSILFDGQNHIIRRASTAAVNSTGIWVSTPNVIVKNVRIENYISAIYLDASAPFSSVTGCVIGNTNLTNITAQSRDGCYPIHTEAEYTIISGNRISNIVCGRTKTTAAIYASSHGTVVGNNHIFHIQASPATSALPTVVYGILIFGSKDVRVESNFVSRVIGGAAGECGAKGSEAAGIVSRQSDIKMVDNIIDLVVGGEYYTQGNCVTIGGEGYGILSRDSRTMLFTGNSISNIDCGPSSAGANSNSVMATGMYIWNGGAYDTYSIALGYRQPVASNNKITNIGHGGIEFHVYYCSYLDKAIFEIPAGYRHQCN